MCKMNWWSYLCMIWGWSRALTIIPLVKDNRKLNHMLIDHETVFVGATNYIYQLSPDLELLMEVTTGPQNDSQKCGINLDRCSFKSDLSPTDNHNKILLLYSEKLVVCGSVFQGKCEIRNSRNISEVLATGNTAVASNEVDVNTISFIAQVLNSETSKMEMMMYVATEFTRFNENKEPALEYSLRRYHPFVSTRLLDQQYFEEKGSLKGETDIQKAGSILYVTGFTSGNYSYILFNDKTSEMKYNSKIAHMCKLDDRLKTFEEVPLKCKTNNKTYNFLKMATVFKPGQILLKSLQDRFPNLTSADDVIVGLFSDMEDNSSAICLFTMQEVQRTVLTNVRKCLNGETDYAANAKYVDGLQCEKVNQGYQDEELLCSSSLNVIIAGIDPLISAPVVQFPATKSQFVSLAVTITTEFTVLFLGTSVGHIRKMVLRTATEAELYGSAIVVDDNHEINPDMVFDRTGMFIYAMSDKKVAKIPVQNCQQYTSCDACLKSRDPYCGWCTLNHRCSLKSECPNPTPSRWKHGLTSANSCIAILNVSPPMAHISQNITLYLTVHDLPRGFNTTYNCVFAFPNGNKKTSPALLGSYLIECRNPYIANSSLTFDHALGHINITLGIECVETKRIIVSKPYLLYKCSSFSSCSRCVDNMYWCDWCVNENRCQYNTDPCQGELVSSRNDTYVQNYTEYIIYSVKIMLPTGQKKFPGRRISANQLEFEIEPIDIVLPNGLFETGMEVLWTSQEFSIENDGLALTLYSCAEQARKDCSFCKNLELTHPAMNCKWCGGKCVYSQNNCVLAVCPGPNVTNLFPNSGHFLGGTVVTITGFNLGVKFSDIENNVTVGGIACNATAKRKDYKPSNRIVCVTGSRSGNGSGPIKILGVTLQKYIYTYKDPLITSIHPNYAAMSGGREINFIGKNLNIGNGASISINNKTCIVIRIYPTSLSCVAPAGSKGSAQVKVQIDGNAVEISGSTFTYGENPTVLSIFPLKSIQSGGRNLTIIGTDLDAVDSIYIFVTFIDGSFSKNESCRVFNSSIIHCPSPKGLIQSPADTEDVPSNFSMPQGITIQANVMEQKQQQQFNSHSAQIGFYMDNIIFIPNTRFILDYVPNPIIFDFEESDQTKAYTQGIVLVIKGKNMNLAATEKEVRVFVGQSHCNVTSLTSDAMYCVPPSEQPLLSNEGNQHPDGIPRVFVVFGYLRKVVGYLRYKDPEGLNLMVYLVPSLFGFAGVIVIIILLVCLRYRKQQKNAEREYKAIQLQLDNLESTVRNECKQAFAELQTDMTDLTTDLDSSRKPYHDYDEYTFRILFPGMFDHIILQPPQRNENFDRHPDVALSHFRLLLNNKHFLLMFIRTLEKQKSFTIRDRANVASLLMILFQNNMEYVTQILYALLIDLIEKSIETKRTKIMLRRTESVVEKLLANWLSLCMYRYLREAAGSSLYTLYQAIKVQVDKGPVDCFTCEARYSLSEDRLLRTEKQLEYSVLTLLVDYKGKPMTKCRVLDCDTITQAKEKMIEAMCRNIPYTQRPRAADLDLELTKEGKILCDEDNSTLKINGWKKYNTLKHYRIDDGAELTLLEHQNCLTLPRSPNGSLHSTGFAFTVNREVQPITRTESEAGCKYWHLVKQDDFNTGIKISSEVFLTRLLATKGTLKKYIDDFFTIILTANESIPPVIKSLFDFLDEAADKYEVEPEVVYNWKCNSVPLRFWVNIIKNPEFVYDINKTNIVDSCLSVVAQAFMDSCSTSDQNLGKDSPSNKLLFAKDIPQYKGLVEKYFQDIKAMPVVSDQDLSAYFNEVSRMATDRFTKENALHELYNYIHEYSNAINEGLEEDQSSSAQQLPAKLGHVITSMEGPSSSGLSFV
ncbi:plexin-B-like isoform X5 [Crassostrea virginica]